MFYMRDDSDGKQVVRNMAHAVVPWTAGYLSHARNYSIETVMPLMGSFDIQAVQLADGSSFDVDTIMVITEFSDKEEWLEDIEEQLGLDGNGERGDEVTLITDTKRRLGNLLRKDMRMENLDREGYQKLTILMLRHAEIRPMSRAGRVA